jgi:hypothetical protein
VFTNVSEDSEPKSLLAACLLLGLLLNSEDGESTCFETSVNYRTTWSYIPEGSIPALRKLIMFESTVLRTLFETTTEDITEFGGLDVSWKTSRREETASKIK